MPRCLIIERHEWETGAASHQLQIPLEAARDFFEGTAERNITIRLANAKQTVLECTVSGIYRVGPTGRRGSATRRVNRLPWIGLMGNCFLFLEETSTPDEYRLWVQYDMAIVCARYGDWRQAVVRGSGRGRRGSRGRLWNIVDGPVDRPILRLPQ
jgi:hypothetical protein